MWIVDFGTAMPEHEAALYEVPFEYVRENVRPARTASKTTITAWWLHERPRGELRAALAGLSRFVCTPRVATYRSFAWLPGTTLPDSATIAFARDDDYFLGVLQSRAHEVWSLRLGTWLGVGNDPRVAAIATTAAELDHRRTAWLNPEGTPEAELKKRTLTNLYNARPTWLANAHASLDRAVWSAYGWEGDPAGSTDEEILTRLLSLNLERAAS